LKVLKKIKIEECLDGVIIKEFLLDDRVNKEFINHLQVFGDLKYYPHFPRPFFKVTKKNKFIIKGVQGNNTFQVFFTKYSKELENDIVKKIICFDEQVSIK